MKKIVYIAILLTVLIGCVSKTPKNTKIQKDIEHMSLDELDAVFDSLNEDGFAYIVRGADREYDTIIDHVKVRYVTEIGYDTPIDGSKHCETE